MNIINPYTGQAAPRDSVAFHILERDGDVVTRDEWIQATVLIAPLGDTLIVELRWGGDSRKVRDAFKALCSKYKGRVSANSREWYPNVVGALDSAIERATKLFEANGFAVEPL